MNEFYYTTLTEDFLENSSTGIRRFQKKNWRVENCNLSNKNFRRALQPDPIVPSGQKILPPFERATGLFFRQKNLYGRVSRWPLNLRPLWPCNRPCPKKEALESASKQKKRHQRFFAGSQHFFPALALLTISVFELCFPSLASKNP